MNPRVDYLRHKLHSFGRYTRGWSHRHIPEKAFVFILGTLIGILAGIGAFILKRMIAFVSEWLTSHLHSDSGNWALIAIPLIGMVLTGILCRYILHDNLSNGVSQLMKELAKKVYKLKPSRTFSFLLASTVTLGFGGSAGSEGPIANTGAAIGSSLATRFKLSPDLVKIMIGCGAGAGIAGIFKAPVGGVMFTLEVLRMEMTTISVLVLIVTAISAAMTAYILSGGTLDISFHPNGGFELDLVPWVILLGIFCGFYSLYYTYFTKKIAQSLHYLNDPWIKNIVAGLLLGTLIIIFPPLYGEGYGIISDIVNSNSSALTNDSIFYSDDSIWDLILIAGGILLAKCFATSATNHGGGVCGDFAPTLFAGCIAGFFFASILNTLFGLHLPVSLFAYFGMSGVMAGAIRAPLMAIFLTCEMGAAYAYFLPLMISGAISFGVVRLFTADSYFTRRLDRNNGLISRIQKQQKS